MAKGKACAELERQEKESAIMQEKEDWDREEKHRVCSKERGRFAKDVTDRGRRGDSET